MYPFDFLYLDTPRLADYMAALDPGVLRELRQISTYTQDGDVPDADINDLTDEEVKTRRESTEELVLSASDKNSFHRLYRAIKSDLDVFDEGADIDIARLERRKLVEITREFEPSPLTQMIDSLLDFAKMAQQVGVVDMEADDEAREAIHGITMLFRGSDEEQKEVPVVSSGEESGTSVFYLAHRKYILRGIDALESESTLVGRVEKVVPQGTEVDLFDMLKILPRSMRRGRVGEDVKAALKEMFRSLPQELGGPISDEAFNLPGPLVIVSPLAVFR